MNKMHIDSLILVSGLGRALVKKKKTTESI